MTQEPAENITGGDPAADAFTSAADEPFVLEAADDENDDAADAAVADAHGPAQQELDTLRGEKLALQDQLLRARAEFDNYRKRTAREMEQVRKTGAQRLMKDLLPIADNLERALAHVEGEASPLAQGVRLVVKQLSDVLSAHGLEAIAAQGQPFDPNVHEALMHQPSDEHPADTVILEYERGYRIQDHILRPAKVVVSSGAADSERETGPAEPEL